MQMDLQPQPLRDVPLTITLNRKMRPRAGHAAGVAPLAEVRHLHLPEPADADATLLVEVAGEPVEASFRNDRVIELHREPLSHGDPVRVWYVRRAS